ncbi:MAG: molybdopterin-dependent oxidoreductase [candidate division WOR-3 bacterium]
MSREIQKTVCPFCTLGCTIGMVFDKGRFWHTYPKGGINQGRLCPRGNIAARYLDYELRLCYPLKGDRTITWQSAFDEINNALRKYPPDEIAVLYDKNLTIEEFQLLNNFVSRLGIKNFASSYIEPEYYFNFLPEEIKFATEEDLANAQLFLLIGDVFNQSPIIARFVLDSRYKRREHRIIGIDSINNYTMNFSDIALICKPGMEPLVIAAVENIINRKTKGIGAKKLCGLAGVPIDIVETVASTFDQIERGVIINVASAGKHLHPLLHCIAPVLLTPIPGKDIKYLPLAESSSFVGSKDFTEIYGLIKRDKIKFILNFGDYFPFFNLPLFQELTRVDLIVTTSTIKYQHLPLPIITLPVPSNLEKSGRIQTVFGPQTINPLAGPVSGAKPISEIIENIGSGGDSINKTTMSLKAQKIETEKAKDMIDKFANSIKEQKIYDKTFCLLGEKIAFDFLGLLNSPEIKINSKTAQLLNINEGEALNIQSKSKRLELKSHITDQVPHQYIAVSSELKEIRELFEYEINTAEGQSKILPVEVKIWKRE